MSGHSPRSSDRNRSKRSSIFTGSTAVIDSASQTALFESQNVLLKHKVAPAGGVFLTLPLTKNLWVQPEVNLDLKGTQWTSGGQTARLNVTYVDVPVLLRYAGPEEDRLKWHVFAGGYTGVRVKATFDSGVLGARMIALYESLRSPTPVPLPRPSTAAGALR